MIFTKIRENTFCGYFEISLSHLVQIGKSYLLSSTALLQRMKPLHKNGEHRLLIIDEQENLKEANL